MSKFPPIYVLVVLLALLLGSIILTSDHFIYWFALRPNTEESRIAKAALNQRDFKSILVLYKTTHKNHNNLIFHHYFFQVILVLISLFVYTSSIGIFTKVFLLAINLHLLIDEISDYFLDKKTLQKWLFAREEKQLSLDYLKYYLIVFGILILVFIFLLFKSFI
jgi:hypothetical protein